MNLKEYWKRTLATVREFLEGLTEWCDTTAAILAIDPKMSADWMRRAWEKSAPSRIYHPRRNGLGEPLPSFCLKIPTGGGKTLLATKVISLLGLKGRGRLRVSSRAIAPKLSGLLRSKVTIAMHPCLWTDTQSWVICSMLLNMDGEPTAGIGTDRERLRHGRRHADHYSRRRRGQFTSALAMFPGISSAHCSRTARL